MNFDPTMRTLILEPVYLSPEVTEDAGSEAVLDETGNFIRDEKGNVIYGA